ncbi:hypothetical protein LTR36_003079 [Oleoguttula mirabilis]|uniref:Vacuolar protein sorting-associated protein 8 central domain-containing protein n=1 Tax=Oleoguttula mirabilis TaxID=1507867 RepID=A0AAV9JWI3_9PEZI|nr:hypothetical protein LTR36_003079 [Oleoguttula mirabilis]
MSSISGGHDEGGNNEDVEADESNRTEEARAIADLDTLGVHDLGDGSPAEEQALTQNGPLVEDELNEDVEHDEADGLIEEDYAQLGKDSGHTVENGALDVEADAGPATPRVQSPLASPGGSGSIPDDTPSLQGSLLSSTGRAASPTPRRTVSRTASGALQPFERRFESRFSASPSPSPRAGSPAFLSPHSRQISTSSQFSQISSQDDGAETPQAPWDVVRWTKLRKITGQAFSEAGKRNFGRPTCLAVSALIAIGTSKGLILGFDYHQTLKIIIGQGTKATECGSVTALAIAADYTTIASGHANGTLFTWEISKPAQPFMRVPPLDWSVLQQAQHSDGHMAGCAILHIGFLGTRHTALVSADAGGMAFSHLATRGLGSVTRTVKATRLLGRYPVADRKAERNRKPSSVLAFSPLPLGNVEQATDGMGLTALLTPYLLVIVSTTPIAQTQHKSPRPKEVKPHSTLSGCLAWFPAVKLKGANTGNSDTKLVYCWSNVLTVLDVKINENQDSNKPPSLVFNSRSRWRSEEAIVAVQWLGRSVLGVLTVSQRLLVVEDGSLQVTDSIDLLHRHIYHQDLFSQQLQSVVERLDSEDPSLHGVVADAFFMSFRAYKGRTFLLGYDDLTVGTLSNWADRLMALMEAGDHIAALRLATEYYAGSANNVTVGLPDGEDARHEIVKERLLAMISASLNYTFAQHDDSRHARLRELADVCFDACINMHDTEYLFNDVFDGYEEAEEEEIFISALEPYVLDGEVKILPPEVVKSIVSYFISENQAARLEELLCRLDPLSFDLDQITMLCRQHSLYDALIYVWTQGIGDYVTPFIDLLSLVKMLEKGEDDDDLSDHPFFASAMKVYPYLAYSLTGRRYPSGDLMDDYDALRVKADLYEYLFAGTPTGWPPGSKRVFRTSDQAQDEPAFPYLVLLLDFDAASFMSMLNEAFEDPFLNEADEDTGTDGTPQVNGTGSRPGYKMTRQHIISIMLDVMRQQESEADQMVYLDMFIARSLPKYPGQLVLSGSLLNQVLRRLCNPPSDAIRDDCQLSVEYLLSAYHPSDVSGLVQALRQARYYRVLKSVYRGERMATELLEAYFVDPEDKEGTFDGIAFCLRPSTGAGQKQVQAVKRTVLAHVQDLTDISVALTARTIATYASDLLSPCIDALVDSHQKFIFLRCLLEPGLLRYGGAGRISAPLTPTMQSALAEQYVQLMCVHEPTHVAEYVGVLPSSDLRLDKVLPAMESAGVVDAAVVLLTRDGLTRDAMERLVAHLQSLQLALISMIDAAAQSPDVESLQEAAADLVEDVVKYTKVGIWLCQGQSATAQRKPRPRTNFAWDVKEDDLDLDEYLWLNLVDAVVQVTKSAALAIQQLDEGPTGNSDGNVADLSAITSALRGNVQQAFTSLLTATAASSGKTQAEVPEQPQSTKNNLSFLRVLRAFLTRAAASAPSLADLRAVLSDIFTAYTFEQGVLSLANELLGSHVFADIEKANELRQRGWRSRGPVCEHCKRRAWGQGIGEIVWDEWVAKEQSREAEKVRKLVERGGGEEARRLERGKAKAKAAVTADRPDTQSEESRRLALVVFACKHVFHRVCLDQDYRDGKPSAGVLYKCPICRVQT